MIKPCAGEAGEGVNDTHYAFPIYYKQRVDGMMVHFFTGLDNLGGTGDRFRVTGHNLRDRCREEIRSQTLHRTTDVAICYDAHQTLFPLP